MNEQALKDRLKTLAKNQNRSFQEVWKLLLLERFLARLSYSKHKNRFIFKGGLLLSYFLTIARETTDIDFLARQLQSEMPEIISTINEICSTEMADGFIMTLKNIEELGHSHMNYPGYRARLSVTFGNMKDHIQIDIGVGDTVEPKQITWKLYHYKGIPMFENSISLQVYPIEAIFSEKLETIISRGSANSRMKDFHDVLLLCRNDDLMEIEQLRVNINTTFKNRKTKIITPIKFNASEYSRLQTLWTAHLRTLNDAANKRLNLPSTIADLVNEVNTWLTRL